MCKYLGWTEWLTLAVGCSSNFFVFSSQSWDFHSRDQDTQWTVQIVCASPISLLHSSHRVKATNICMFHILFLSPLWSILASCNSLFLNDNGTLYLLNVFTISAWKVICQCCVYSMSPTAPKWPKKVNSGLSIQFSEKWIHVHL